MRSHLEAAMSEVQGTYRDGHVHLDSPVAWPNGIRVEISPIPKNETPMAQPSQGGDWGIEDDWPDTPENRAEILRRIDAVEPLEMTPAEVTEWQAMLQWFDEHSREVVKRDMGLSQ
jgi:hypothetical protein